MKILFLSHVDINLYLFRRPVMEALLARGHDVFALVPKGEYSKKLENSGIKVVHYEISRASLNPLKELKTIAQIARILRALKPDILHTFMLKPNIYGALASPFAGVSRVICSVTGLGSFYIDKSLKARVVRLLSEWLNYFAFKLAKRVIFQNSDDLNYFVKQRILKREKARLIRGSGIDTDYFCMDQISSDVVKKYRENLNLNDKILVLMVARAIAHKGVREFYNAARILGESKEESAKKISFVYVGESDFGNISAIPAHELESPYVTWLGHRDDVRELIAACDIFVLPSYREGISRTLLEASSLAKPMITCDAVGCKEVVKDGENGLLVPVMDSQTLADKIAFLARENGLREAFGCAARARAMEFDVRDIVKAHLDVYSEVTDV